MKTQVVVAITIETFPVQVPYESRILALVAYKCVFVTYFYNMGSTLQILLQVPTNKEVNRRNGVLYVDCIFPREGRFLQHIIFSKDNLFLNRWTEDRMIWLHRCKCWAWKFTWTICPSVELSSYFILVISFFKWNSFVKYRLRTVGYHLITILSKLPIFDLL